MYKLKYIYDSVNDSTSELGCVGYMDYTSNHLMNIDLAIDSIVEHYEMYQKLENCHDFEEQQKILNEYSKRPWFTERKEPYVVRKDGSRNAIKESDIPTYDLKDDRRIVYFHNLYVSKFSISLIMDGGHKQIYSCEWCSYYEVLRSVESYLELPKREII